MKSHLNFNKDGDMVSIHDGIVNISLPLSIKEFRDVYNKAPNPDVGELWLAYVANYAHHGSFANLEGLSGDEKHREICKHLGLNENFKPNKYIKAAIKYFNNTYERGIFGAFKELRKSYEITKRSISVVNKVLDKSTTLLNNLNLDTIEDVKLASSLSSDIFTQLNVIRRTVTDITSEIDKIKDIESLLLITEERNIIPRGADRVPKSAL